MPGTLQAVANPQTSERRAHSRQQVFFSFVELENNNGGIVLNISERGLAMQAVGSLTDDQLPRMRFQFSQCQIWVETRARIVWIGASKKTAGVEFIDLPDEARKHLKQWISWILHSNESVEGVAAGEETEPVKDGLPRYEPENAIRLPEPETTARALQDQNPHSITEGAIVPPSVESRDADAALPYSSVKSTTPAVTENASGTAGPPPALPYQETRSDREIQARKPIIASRKSGQLIGPIVGTVLLLSVPVFLAYHLPKTGNSQQDREVITTVKAPESPTDNSASPKNSVVDPTIPSEGTGFLLQVGAVTHKENAEALAEALQRRSFPTFVYFRGTDRFYRVVVGPYGNVDSTLRAKKELKEQGFESFRMQRNP